jgi:hypothetical protein
MTRSKSVTALGTFFIVFAVVAGLAGIFGMWMLTMVGGTRSLSTTAPPIVLWASRHVALIVAAQCFVAACMLVGGVGILKMRWWGWAFVELACWLVLAYSSVFGGLWIALSIYSSADARSPILAAGSVVIGVSILLIGILTIFVRRSRVHADIAR